MSASACELQENVRADSLTSWTMNTRLLCTSENPRTGKIIAEKLARYVEDKIKAKDAMIEKLRLKNVTLRNQIHKVHVRFSPRLSAVRHISDAMTVCALLSSLQLESQVNSKEELGDVLHYIDFHQLQIENKQYLAKIEEKNEELLQLKMTTGKTVQALNDLKANLNAHVTQGEWLRRELQQKQMDAEKVIAGAVLRGTPHLQNDTIKIVGGEIQLEQEVVAVKRETKKQRKMRLQLQRQTSVEIGVHQASPPRRPWHLGTLLKISPAACHFMQGCHRLETT